MAAASPQPWHPSTPHTLSSYASSPSLPAPLLLPTQKVLLLLLLLLVLVVVVAWPMPLLLLAPCLGTQA